MKTILATVHGSIHGVGYKYFVLKTALSNHIGGFVKNEKDGTMTIKACGDEVQLEKFLSLIENGNGFSKVDCITISDAPLEIIKEFRVIY